MSNKGLSFAALATAWFVDSDGRLYRFSEWYGWNGTANQGLRLEDSAIADEIKTREKDVGIDKRQIIRLAGPDCFNKKPDYRGGGQGPSTAEVFSYYYLLRIQILLAYNFVSSTNIPPLTLYRNSYTFPLTLAMIHLVGTCNIALL